MRALLLLITVSACAGRTPPTSATSDASRVSDVIEDAEELVDVAALDAPDATRDVASERTDTASDADADDARTPSVDASSRGFGARCDRHIIGACDPGMTCLDSHSGFWRGFCATGCQNGCPDGSACVLPAGESGRFCLRTCRTHGDCRLDDGQACVFNSEAGTTICTLGVVASGQRGGGSACYSTTPGPFQAPALARHAFASPNVSVSVAREDSLLEAEGNVVADPTGGRAVVTYIGVGADGVNFVATSLSDATSPAWRVGGAIHDAVERGSDPVLAFGRDGALHMAYLGYRREGVRLASSDIYVADSVDSGATWSTPRVVGRSGISATPHDKPWLALGPGVAPVEESMYAAYRLSGSPYEVVATRSDDGGRTWTVPTQLDSAMSYGTTMSPNDVQLATGRAGEVAAAWVSVATDDYVTLRNGSPQNRVFFRLTRDGFTTVGPRRLVSRPEDSPVFEQPPVALDGGVAHVAFVSGNASGAWDIVLATSADDGVTWRHRKVNDELDACATHAFPAMAVDPVTHDVHLVWMENRFGDGAVAYARCPGDPLTPCGRNEAVNDASFRFTTERNPLTWHGDYLGLTLTPSGDLWATWSDTRTGTPAMYVSHGRAR